MQNATELNIIEFRNGVRLGEAKKLEQRSISIVQMIDGYSGRLIVGDVSPAFQMASSDHNPKQNNDKDT